MPGGIYKDVSQEERRRRQAEAYRQLIGGLAADGGVLGGPPVDRENAIIDEELLHPDAADRAADAAAVAPQEYGNPTPTLMADEEPDPEPMVDRIDRQLAQGQPSTRLAEAHGTPAGPPPAWETDPIDVELLRQPQEYQQLSGASFNKGFAGNYKEIRQAQAEDAASREVPPARATKTPTAPLPGEPFSRDDRMREAGDAYDRRTAELDPVNQFDAANANRKRVVAPDAPSQRAPLYTKNLSGDELDELTDRGLVLDAGTRKNLVSTGVDPGASPNPYGESETRWEDEFKKSHQALSDNQIRMRAAIIGIFGGAIGGDPNMARDFVHREQRTKGAYDQGLAAARQNDRSEQRIPKALAQALAATGNVTVEEAADLKMNSPLLAAYTNGMYSQGASAEKLDRLQQQFNAAQQGLNQRATQQSDATKDVAATHEAGANTRAEISAGAQERLATLRAGQKQDPRLLALHLEKNIPGYDYTRAKRFALGDDTARPPVDDATLEKLVDEAGAAMQDPATRRNLLAELAARAERAKKQAVVDLTPGQIAETKSITLLATKVRDAAKAWSEMDDSAKGAYVQYGRAIPEAERSRRLGKYQPQATRLEALTGQIRREMLGLAQTIPELASLATRMGVTSETWDPYKGPGAFEEAMRSILEEAATRRRLQRQLKE